MTVALALTVPALVAAGLLARRPMPEIDLPPILAAPAFDPGDTLAVQLKNTGSGLALRITTLKPEDGSDLNRLSVQLISDPKRPELLVYWHAGPGGATTAIADDSYLLGALTGTEPALFRLPAAAAEGPGSLIFFSLAQQEVVDTVALRGPNP